MALRHARAAQRLLAALIVVCSCRAIAGQSCADKVKSGAETDVDCGGGSCPQCLTARGCLSAGDCLSGSCVSGKCQEPAVCYNKVKDRRETDVDCGGGECYAPCTVGKACVNTWDCRSRNCTRGICQVAATCSNFAVDGLETALNCGGSQCPPCASGQRCVTGADCLTGVCTNSVCVAPSTCSNGVLDSGEGDIDCGGPSCPLCGTGRACKAGSDCLSGSCLTTTGRCGEAPYCYDGVQNGRETDVDCGGGGCNAACSSGARCIGRWDCMSRICSGGVCVPGASPSPSPSPQAPAVVASPSPSPQPPAAPRPSCADGIRNNGESDVDCGGPCAPCEGGGACFKDSDCGTSWCIL